MPLAASSLFSIVIFYSAARLKIGALVQERLVVEDPDRRKRIVSSIHDSSYMGLNRTTDMVSAKYYWPGLTSDVKAYQARRQGGFEGVRANPPFDLQKILYTPLNCLKVVH